MVVDIAPDQAAFPAGPGPGGHGVGQGEVVPAGQAQQNNLQQVLADLIASGPGLPGLLDQGAQAAGYGLLRIQADEDAAAGVGAGLQPLHPQHHVFHGAAVLTGLGVGDARVDHHKVVDGHGKTVLADLEVAMAAGDEKQLPAGMGVELGGPLLAVTGVGHIAQPGPAADRALVQGTIRLCQNVLMGTHGAPLPSGTRLHKCALRPSKLIIASFFVLCNSPQ